MISSEVHKTMLCRPTNNSPCQSSLDGDGVTTHKERCCCFLQVKKEVDFEIDFHP